MTTLLTPVDVELILPVVTSESSKSRLLSALRNAGFIIQPSPDRLTPVHEYHNMHYYTEIYRATTNLSPPDTYLWLKFNRLNNSIDVRFPVIQLSNGQSTLVQESANVANKYPIMQLGSSTDVMYWTDKPEVAKMTQMYIDNTY